MCGGQLLGGGTGGATAIVGRIEAEGAKSLKCTTATGVVRAAAVGRLTVTLAAQSCVMGHEPGIDEWSGVWCIVAWLAGAGMPAIDAQCEVSPPWPVQNATAP